MDNLQIKIQIARDAILDILNDDFYQTLKLSPDITIADALAALDELSSEVVTINN